MKRRVLSLVIAGIMSAGLIACGSSDAGTASSEAPAASSAEAPSAQAPEESTEAPASDAEPFIINIGSVYLDGSVFDETLVKITEDLNASGLFKATYYNNSTLGVASEMTEQVFNGENTCATGSPADIGDACGHSELAVTMAPFLYDDYRDVYKIAESDWYQGILADIQNAGVYVTPVNLLSGERYFWTNKVINTPEDMAGLKLRVPTSSHYLSAFEAFGATPTAINVAELYTSLAQKTVDACEFPIVDGYGRQLYEVLHNVTDFPYMCEFLVAYMSMDVWNAMTPEQQEVWNKVWKDGEQYGFDIYEDMTKEYKQKLIDEGMEFNSYDVDAFKALTPKYYELMTKNAGWPADMYDIVTGILGE